MELNSEDKKRYARHISLTEVGIEGQQKLKSARVLVIGAGGLGCPVLQYLAAAGVGNIGIIDFDTIDVTNLQRQVLFTTNDIGQPKVDIAVQRLSALNPLINITPYNDRLTTTNALALFEKYDIIVDGSDNFSTRYLVNDASIITNKPLVYGSIYKFEGQVAVFNYNHGPSYRCLFPNPPDADSIPNCSEIGVVGVLPGIIGSYQANETLKIILSIGEILSGKLMLINALNNDQQIIKIKPDQNQIKLIKEKTKEFPETDYDLLCSAQVLENEISANELNKLLKEKNIQLIDVREAWEEPRVEELAAEIIPLAKLEEHVSRIVRDKQVVVFCQSGKRSMTAITVLKEKYGFDNLLSLSGGIMNWKYN